jgi:transposase-like protein
MVTLTEPFDPYEIADAPLREKEQRLIKELDGVRAARASIAIAREMAGRPAPSNLKQTTEATPTGATVVSPLVGTPYYGLPLAEAAMKCLSLTDKKPMTVKQIWKTLSDAGVNILSDRPEAALGWAVRKRERKFDDVILVGNGEWGLTEWYTPERRAEIKANRNVASGRNREEHSARTKAGMNMAFEQRGVRIGAVRKMTPELKAKAFEMLKEKGSTIRQVAEKLGVATSSLNGHKISSHAAKRMAREEAAKNSESSQLRLVK